MIQFIHLYYRAEDFLGLIPEFLSPDDPRPAREQFSELYAFGGGWRPFEGFKWDPLTSTIRYPGDSPYKAIAMAKLRDEMIWVFPYAWVMIEQLNGDYEISRMD